MIDGTRDRNETPTREMTLWRIYLLRAGYLLIAVGMGMQKVPAFLHHRPWELMHGVVNSMLLALVLLAVLGLRYPLKMLPLLFWEIAWKATWLLAVALPAWQNHTMDALQAVRFWQNGKSQRVYRNRTSLPPFPAPTRHGRRCSRNSRCCG